MEIKFTMKNWISVGFCIAFVAVAKVFAPIAALSPEGNTALFFMLSLVILIATESLNGGLIGIIAVVGLPLLGLMPSLVEASAAFGNQLFFYMLACYAIATVMGKLPLSKRILLFFLKRFGKTNRGVISALLLTTALLSSFISNFPACMLVLIISKEYLQLIEDEADRIKTRRSLMVGIIISVAIGGIITPIGSSCVVMASAFLAEAGHPITFVQWLFVGLPIAVVWFPITLFLLFKIFPPAENTDPEERQAFIQRIDDSVPKEFSSREKFTIVILLITFACWVANFNLMLVTCCCGIALLFPGFKLISWDDFNKNAGWGTCVMVCALVAVASALQATGVLDWFLGIFQAILPVDAGPIPMLLVFGVFTAVILIIIPNGPVLMTILGTTLIPLGEVIGISPVILVVGFACFTTYACIAPIDAISLVVYESGANFTATDEPKAGIPVVIVGTILTAVWIPIACGILGL